MKARQLTKVAGNKEICDWNSHERETWYNLVNSLTRMAIIADEKVFRQFFNDWLDNIKASKLLLQPVYI